jgi:predicted O-methyltransferase YrrM
MTARHSSRALVVVVVLLLLVLVVGGAGAVVVQDDVDVRGTAGVVRRAVERARAVLETHYEVEGWEKEFVLRAKAAAKLDPTFPPSLARPYATVTRMETESGSWRTVAAEPWRGEAEQVEEMCADSRWAGCRDRARHALAHGVYGLPWTMQRVAEGAEAVCQAGWGVEECVLSACAQLGAACEGADEDLVWLALLGRASLQWTPLPQFDPLRGVQWRAEAREEQEEAVAGALDEGLWGRYWVWVRALEEHVALAGQRVTDGSTASYAATVYALLLTARRLPRTGAWQTVCEVGFNGGHSALAFLTARTDVRVVSFELGQHPVSATSAAWLQRLFGAERLRVIYGDSRETLPRELGRGVECDLAFIDGGHTFDVASADILSFSLYARRRGAPLRVVLDDASHPGVAHAIWNAVDAGRLAVLSDGAVEGYRTTEPEPTFTARALLHNHPHAWYGDWQLTFAAPAGTAAPRVLSSSGERELTPPPAATANTAIIIRQTIAEGVLLL